MGERQDIVFEWTSGGKGEGRGTRSPVRVDCQGVGKRSVGFAMKRELWHGWPATNPFTQRHGSMTSALADCRGDSIPL